MKTKKDERAGMRKFAALKALHSDRAFSPRHALSLIADVDDAVVLLGEAGLAISTGAGTYDLAQRITDFLKEPK